MPDEECIILKSSDDPGDNARPIEYDDTPDTIRMRTELLAYNAVLAGAFIDIPELEVAMVDRLVRVGPETGKVKQQPVDHHHQFVRRIFSRGSWELNGRFYGPWWQLIGSGWRKNIFINDTPTVEVDFKGLHVSILAAEQGVVIEGDAYALPEGLVDGVTADEQRKIIKNLVLIAMNAKTKQAAYSSFRDGYKPGELAKGMKNGQLEMLLTAFVAKHPYLEASFGADQGIRLMGLDAKIAERVHRHFTAQGVPVLSVHDSFIVDYTRVGELKRVMAEASQEVIGVSLPVSTGASGIDEVTALGWAYEVLLDFKWWSQLPRSQGYLDRLRGFEQRCNREVVPYD